MYPILPVGHVRKIPETEMDFEKELEDEEKIWHTKS